MATIEHNFSYASALSDALKVNWRIEDLIGGDKSLDFDKPFLPDSLAGVEGLKSLNTREKLALNQIRGKTYLYLFGFVEEFIAPKVAALAGDFAIDFGTVTRCDTSAVAVVLAWKRAAAARGGALVLSSMPKDLSSLAQLYGVDQLLA